MRFVFGGLAPMLLKSEAGNVEPVGDGERQRDDDHLSVAALLHQVRLEGVLKLYQSFSFEVINYGVVNNRNLQTLNHICTVIFKFF
jgi:hypothetical protein